MEKLPITYLDVEFEEIDGRKKIKRLADGSNPISAYANMLVEMDTEHRKEHNDWPLIEVQKYRVKGKYGEPDHWELTIYSLESGKREAVSRVVMTDADTGKPAPIIEDTRAKGYIPKSESLFHVEQILTQHTLAERAKKRGLQMRTESVKGIEEIISTLEGPCR
jgi:hypothetical protein